MHYGLSAGGILRDNCLEFLAFFVCSFNNISYRHASLLEIEIVMTDYIRFLHIDKALETICSGGRAFGISENLAW